jgi:hypothetical protein
MKKAIVTLSTIALLACTTAGCGQPSQQHSYVAQDQISIIAKYTEHKLQVLSQRDSDGASKLSATESQRIAWLINHNKSRGIQIIDHGLRLSVLQSKSKPDSEQIIIAEEISLKTIQDDIISFSYAKEYHQLLLRSGEVYSDIEINLDHPDFDDVIQMPELSSRVVRDLPGDPYRRKTQLQSSGTSQQTPSNINSSLYLTASTLKRYAADHCAGGTYNSPPYPIYPQDCANFVSQCLLAGGLAQIDNSTKSEKIRWNQDTYWWFDNGTSYQNSVSWSVADGLGNHLYNRYGSSPTVHWVWENAHIGDVILIDRDRNSIWDHAMIVTTAERSSSGVFILKASGHTNDRCDEDFYALAGRNGWWIQIIHVS